MIKGPDGRLYPTLYAAFKAQGLSVAGSSDKRQILTHGFLIRKGGRYEYVNDDGAPLVHKPHTTVDYPAVPAIAATPHDLSILERLKSRYSDTEIEQIVSGKGIEKNRIPYPEIHLHGKHHKMLVMSDTHIGSIYSPEEWHALVSDFANTNGIEAILHCGDLVEGLKIARAGTQIYELSEIGFDAQRAKAIELMSLYKPPIYIISGNHDMYFNEYAGANIVKSIADAVPNMTYIGHDQADIEVDGCIIRLFHGGDGSSYAISYRMQKLIESINGGHKPNILLAGHTHKYLTMFDRNIHAVSVPCMQMQTAFMRGKKISAHTGFLVMEFDTNNGNVANFSITLYPFYA